MIYKKIIDSYNGLCSNENKLTEINATLILEKNATQKRSDMIDYTVYTIINTKLQTQQN